MEKEVARTFKGRLTSDTAASATMLTVLLGVEPKHPWVEVLTKRILRTKSNHHWSSTLENGLALVSLCKLHALTASELSNYAGTLSGSGLKESVFSSKSTFGQSFAGTGEIRLASSGIGKLFVSVQTEGLVPPESLKPTDREIKVRRRWLNSEGKVLSDWHGEKEGSLEVSVGDLVWVEVMLQTRQANLDNIAVVDALPGGFTVENPRLATSAVRLSGGEVLAKAARADRTEFLDDRVVLFASAKPVPRVFRYAIRAVAGGEFLVPGIQASCMYDETLSSLDQSDVVKVIVQ